MSDRPHVNVIYQDAKQPATMGCLELAVSLAMLLVIVAVVSGSGVVGVIGWLLFGA